MNFTVVVGECVQVGLGNAVVQVGGTSNVPVNLISTVGITNLTFSVNTLSNRFTNWTFSSSNISVAAATVENAGSASPIFTLATQPGQVLTSPSVIGSVGFTVVPGPSVFAQISPTNIVGTKSDGTGVGNISGLPGQIAVISAQPLLGASVGANAALALTIYGNPGSNYQVFYTTNLTSSNWQPVQSVLMTNLQQNIILNPTVPQIFYRTQ